MLRNKAKSIRKETGDGRWKAPIEKSDKSVFRTVGYSLLRPFQILAFEPMALILDLYSAILLGILYLFFGAFPFVFEGVYGFNLWQTGLTFLGMLLGMFSGAMMSGVWVKVRVKLIENNARITGIEGKSEPEYRLPPVIIGSVLVTIGLFWFAWTSFPWVHWIMPIIGSGIFGAGVSTSSPCIFHGVHLPTIPLKHIQATHAPTPRCIRDPRSRASRTFMFSVAQSGSHASSPDKVHFTWYSNEVALVVQGRASRLRQVKHLMAVAYGTSAPNCVHPALPC